MQNSTFSTLGAALDWAESEFIKADLYFGHGTDNAWDEAVWLVLATLNLPLDSGSDILDRALSQSEQDQIAVLIRRRVDERIPVAYLLKQAFFAGYPFYVDERVIIPRSPIAELILNHFQPWIPETQVHQILDLCCGSACIGIACAHAFPTASVDAVDIDNDAMAVAKINVDQHALSERINLIHSNLFTGLAGKRYDIIVCNPPYVDAEDMQDCPEEYRWEPELALAAGADGLIFADHILAVAKNYLTEHGILILEVGNSAAALEAKYPRLPFIWLEFEYGGAGVCLLHAYDL